MKNTVNTWTAVVKDTTRRGFLTQVAVGVSVLWALAGCDRLEPGKKVSLVSSDRWLWAALEKDQRESIQSIWMHLKIDWNKINWEGNIIDGQHFIETIIIDKNTKAKIFIIRTFPNNRNLIEFVGQEIFQDIHFQYNEWDGSFQNLDKNILKDSRFKIAMNAVSLNQ
jgi:hypothetical protein